MKKEKILLNIERKKGKLTLYVKIPKRLEDYFSGASANETQQSTTWQDKEGVGCVFYILSDAHRELETSLSYATFNDFGDGLIRQNRINLAPLRTVGASKGVYLFASNFQAIDNVNFEHYIKQLGLCTKMIWETMIRDKKVKAIISFEV